MTGIKKMSAKSFEINSDPQKVGSAAEAPRARLQANSRSKRDFLRKGGEAA